MLTSVVYLVIRHTNLSLKNQVTTSHFIHCSSLPSILLKYLLFFPSATPPVIFPLEIQSTHPTEVQQDLYINANRNCALPILFMVSLQVQFLGTSPEQCSHRKMHIQSRILWLFYLQVFILCSNKAQLYTNISAFLTDQISMCWKTGHNILPSYEYFSAPPYREKESLKLAF